LKKILDKPPPIMRLWVFVLSSALLVQVALSDAERQRLRVRRLRIKPEERAQAAASEAVSADELEDIEASASDRDTRQLSNKARGRTRIRRPQLATEAPPVSEAFTDFAEDESDDFTLSRGAPRSRGGQSVGAESRIEIEDEEPERPRFIPSRGSLASSRRTALPSALASTSSSSSSSSRNSLAPKLSSPNSDGYKIVCYYTNWSQYRPKTGKYLPEYIDPFLCTHVIFAFGWIKNGKLTSFEANDESVDGKTGLYERVTSLKNANP